MELREISELKYTRCSHGLVVEDERERSGNYDSWLLEMPQRLGWRKHFMLCF